MALVLVSVVHFNFSPVTAKANENLDFSINGSFRFCE